MTELETLMVERDRLVALYQSLPGQLRQIEIKINKYVQGTARYSTLSPQQLRVLNLIHLNKCNKEIAVEMGLTERTIKFHISGMLKKLGGKSRRDL